MTTETSNARGEVVAWIRVRPDGSPDWAEDCIADDEHFLNPAMEADGYRLRPLIYADAAPPPAAARGDVPYDRELIARMLDVCGHPKFTLDAYMEQARLLREADNAAAANVGTVAARGDVRGLVAKLAAHVRPTCSELWDEAQAFLAAEGVQAGAPLYAAARKLRDSARRMDDGSRWVPGTVFKQFTKALAQEHGNGQG